MTIEQDLAAVFIRISEDHDALLEAGIEVLVTWPGTTGDPFVEVELCAPDEAVAERILKERYGPRVRIDYQGADSSPVEAVEWEEYEVISETELVVRYATLAVCAPAGFDVAETDEAVRITAYERCPLYQKLVPTGRELRVTLKAPLGGRAVFDGSQVDGQGG